MDIQRREKIYDRLSEISMKMEIKILPDPRYINEKLGQCHIFIEEVEKFYIEVSKEMSIIQRAFNNALAGYETSRDDLIATDPDIMSLPSLKDREAKANLSLKKELMEIKSYKNDLIDLENLQKAINVKFKNLGRINADIKVQLKLMDSQIRLGTPTVNSEAARSLAEELSKSTVGLDIFNQAKTKMEEEIIADPTKPLNVDSILSDTKNISSINDLPIQKNSEIQSEERSLADRLLNPLPTDPIDDLIDCMPKETPTIEEDAAKLVIDLDKVLSTELSTPTAGGEQKNSVEKTETSTKNESKQKETPKPKNSNEIDIESLLSQFK